MHWIYRPGEIKDITAAYDLLPRELVCDPALKARFPALWRQWMADGSITLSVIEDREQVGASPIVAFGISSFLTDSFLAEAETTLAPYLSPEIARRAIQGGSVLLPAAEVARANSADGLNLYVAHIGWDTARSDEEINSVKAKLLDAFVFVHSGYQLKNVMQEVFSTGEMERAVAFGALVKNDYSDYFRDRPSELPPPERRPYLVGVRRDQVREGAYMSPIFHYTPPRFFFRPGEQDLLLRALLDHTDEELARSLSLSSSAIHKKWRSIYARVADADARFFPSDPSEMGNSRRGLEKRRTLLGYLRHHPEELRPITPPERLASRHA